MTTDRSGEPAEPSLTRGLLYAARYYLAGRRLLLLAGLAILAGLALNWSWLVAAGIAPVLIGALPCLAMCALGLCMNRAGGSSCSTAAGDRGAATAIDDTAPARRTVTLNVSPAFPVGQPPGGTVVAPPANPEPQSLKERNMTDG